MSVDSLLLPVEAHVSLWGRGGHGAGTEQEMSGLPGELKPSRGAYAG